MTDDTAVIRPLLLAIAADPDMPRSVREAAADAEGAVDVEAVVARAGMAIVALEGAASTIKARADTLRPALLQVMLDSGAVPVASKTHTFSYSETARALVVDQSLIPPSFMAPQPDKPDTAAIARALKAGGEVPGAVLSNAAPSLTIRARKS